MLLVPTLYYLTGIQVDFVFLRLLKPHDFYIVTRNVSEVDAVGLRSDFVIFDAIACRFLILGLGRWQIYSERQGI